LISVIEEDKENIMVITKQCPQAPEFPLPGNFSSSFDYLCNLTMQGIARQYPGNNAAKKRAGYELEIINKLGVSDYFLISADCTNWAKEQAIPVGPGRGSAPASITAYAIGITGIDPLKYNLPFERFINPEQPSVPGFDIDFSRAGREMVVKYVITKYGKNRVGRITNFSAREKGHVIGLHTAGLVISKTDLADCAPLYHENETGKLYNDPETGIAAVQCSIKNLEKYGLEKFDLFGLKTLDEINAAEELIRKRGGIYSDFSVSKIPLDDRKAFDMLSGGDTQGIFQFENNAIQEPLRQFKPDCFTGLVLLYACNRPGLLEHLPQIIERKHKRRPVEYPLPCLEDILAETYGVIVYQEQMMFIIQRITGYSLAQADILRRIMMKKTEPHIETERERFIEAAVKQGFTNREAEQIFILLVSTARYAFNKSHAIAYTLISYQTAYLKANFREEFVQTFSVTEKAKSL
jgi:DNA polymerase-3 subunit alpha